MNGYQPVIGIFIPWIRGQKSTYNEYFEADISTEEQRCDSNFSENSIFIVKYHRNDKLMKQ